MITSNISQNRKPGIGWIFWGIPFIIIIGSLMHFVYDWSGNLPIVGLFAPVNESVWEHLKMTFWPMLFWWLLGYIFLCDNKKLSACEWFFSCSISLIICPLFITSFYYTYTGAFGINSLMLDIFSMLLGVLFAQILSLHSYRYMNPNWNLFYCLFAFITIFILISAFLYFTFEPPHYPLFIDSSTGKYGI